MEILQGLNNYKLLIILTTKNKIKINEIQVAPNSYMSK